MTASGPVGLEAPFNRGQVKPESDHNIPEQEIMIKNPFLRVRNRDDEQDFERRSASDSSRLIRLHGVHPPRPQRQNESQGDPY